jgi:hypothetical protein
MVQIPVIRLKLNQRPDRELHLKSERKVMLARRRSTGVMNPDLLSAWPRQRYSSRTKSQIHVVHSAESGPNLSLKLIAILDGYLRSVFLGIVVGKAQR